MSADTDAEAWDDVGWIVSSKYRRTVLTALANDGAATPSTLRDTHDISIASISHALGQLRDRGYVELLVSEDRRKGRVYGATDVGEQIASQVSEVQR